MKKILCINSIRSTALVVTMLISAFTVFTACNRASYLDVDASNRPPLSAKISFVNARPVSNQNLLFWTYTSQVTPTAIAMNKATPYLDAQFGLVQINITALGGSSYLASRVFGGSATFSATGGPNGPIAGYYHTVMAVKGANNADSLMLFYDDLSAPAAGKAKLRFVNLAQGAGPVDVSFGGTSIFSKVPYGAAGGAVLSGPELNVNSIGPYITLNAGSGNIAVRSSSTNTLLEIKGGVADNLTLQAGKIYTVFVNGDASGPLAATVLQHN